ncbi:MauE/DoxX family redox-associated membrane protein [Nocardiopsis sp. NPDC057823]|uniref:MauE/DoxX family redox-associated membrane protein n=1 Tax=Nocardiopsis sp. NPDC057823 TaxID=3346256 RepID=UPI0036710FD6
MLPLTALFLQLAVAGIFLASGLAKVRGRDNETTWAVLAERLRLRRLPVRTASAAHSAVELAIGLVLLTGTWARVPALAAATALFAAFTLLALYSARAGTAVPCSCFGRARTDLGWPHVWRNLALTCAAATGLGCAWASAGAPPASWGEIGLAAAAAAAVTAATVSFDDLVDLFAAGTGERPGVRTPRS